MTTVPRPLDYEVLVGCSWVPIRAEHVRTGDVFRMLRKEGSVYLAASRLLSDIDDCGLYTPARTCTKDSFPF